MASTTRRPSAAADRRAAVENRILSAVEELLKGGTTCTELGVERIAAAGGLSRSTFHLYFRDKVDVLLRVIASVKAGVFEAGAVWHPNEDGLDGLARTYESMIKHYREHAALLAAIDEVAAYEPVVREAWLADQDRFIDRTADLLVEEQEAGRTQSTIDAVRAATMIVRSGAQIAALHVATSDAADDAVVARELACEHWYGVYRRPS
jgi:AcrR family transcriptional regulator